MKKRPIMFCFAVLLAATLVFAGLPTKAFAYALETDTLYFNAEAGTLTTDAAGTIPYTGQTGCWSVSGNTLTLGAAAVGTEPAKNFTYCTKADTSALVVLAGTSDAVIKVAAGATVTLGTTATDDQGATAIINLEVHTDIEGSEGSKLVLCPNYDDQTLPVSMYPPMGIAASGNITNTFSISDLTLIGGDSQVNALYDTIQSVLPIELDNVTIESVALYDIVWSFGSITATDCDITYGDGYLFDSGNDVKIMNTDIATNELGAFACIGASRSVDIVSSSVDVYCRSTAIGSNRDKVTIYNSDIDVTTETVDYSAIWGGGGIEIASPDKTLPKSDVRVVGGFDCIATSDNDLDITDSTVYCARNAEFSLDDISNAGISMECMTDIDEHDGLVVVDSTGNINITDSTVMLEDLVNGMLNQATTGNINITRSTVNATECERRGIFNAAYNSMYIDRNKDVNIMSSNVTALAEFEGIDAAHGSVIIDSSKVNASAGVPGDGYNAFGIAAIDTISFKGNSTVDATGETGGVVAQNDIEFALTKGGKVTGKATMTGVESIDPAGIVAWSSDTITLAKNNEITTPENGVIGKADINVQTSFSVKAEFVADKANADVPAAVAVVEFVDNAPKTGMDDSLLFIAAIAAAASLAILSAAYAVARKRNVA